ncbi:MAG: hypothetical protein NTW25_15260 [Candidatus Kapabacteria bacterium]|nr:hypothetical protein [Candidatus Kapabacteria bacterium]
MGILKDKINDVHDGFSVSWHPNSKQIAIGNIYGLKVYNLNYSYLNEDISDNVFTIQAPKLTFNNINLVNCYDSETSDTTLSNFIINDGDIPFVIDTAFSHSSLYSNSVQIINETFPIIIPPHQSKSLKVRFKISNKSDAIFAFGNKFKLLTLIFSVTKRGVNVVYLEKIDFGKVPVKSTKNINLSKEIYNQSPKDLTISSTYFEDCIETNFKMETFFPLTIPSYKKIVGNYDLSFTPITKGIKTCILNNIIKEDPLCSMKFILTGEGIETNDIDEEVKSKNEYEIELIDNILKIQNIKGYYLKIDLVDITGRTLFAEKITNTQYFEKELNVNLKNIFLYLRIQNENSVKIYSILGEVLNELNK